MRNSLIRTLILYTDHIMMFWEIKKKYMFMRDEQEVNSD
jgi:hypothetical protein